MVYIFDRQHNLVRNNLHILNYTQINQAKSKKLHDLVHCDEENINQDTDLCSFIYKYNNLIILQNGWKIESPFFRLAKRLLPTE